MISRRQYLQLAASAGVALAINPERLLAAGERQLIKRTIPGTSEQLPVVGLGSSASFARLAGAGNAEAVGAILQALASGGGTVFDTAPSYGQAEAVAARVAKADGLAAKLFWATKVNVARSGGQADATAARAQIDNSIAMLGKPQMDLIQVHNLGDVPTQLAILREYQAAGRVRYIGATTTYKNQYAELEGIMGRQPLNFIGIDYAIDNREVEERIFPLAQERGIGVLVYQPFGRARLWQKVKGKPLPDWAADYDIASWAQFFLKFVVAHPAVTAATPATSQPRNVIDNLGAATGRLPDAAGRKRMIAYMEAL